MKNLIIILSLYSSSLFAGALDVNDVSYLLPLDDFGPRPFFSLDKLQALSSDNFKKVLTFEYPNLEIDKLPYTDARPMKLQSNWFLTSWRFDPCGENFHFYKKTKSDTLIVGQKPGCQARIRLVFQPLNIFDYPLADALHILFALTEKQSLELAEKLKVMKSISSKIGAPTARVNLGTHPGLSLEMKNGKSELGEYMLSTIRLVTAKAKLEHITLSVRTLVNNWKFVGGSLRNGVWTRFTTKFTANFYDWEKSSLLLGVEELKCDELSICVLAPVPAASQDNSLSVLNEIFSPNERDQQVAGYRSLLTERKAEVVDNPLKTNFFNTNCISCHQSSNLRNRDKLIEVSPFSPSGPTPYTQKRYTNNQTNSVINFGYFGTIARVSSRTAAESVLAAERANKLLNLVFKEEPIGDLSSYWKCLMSKPNSNECLSI